MKKETAINELKQRIQDLSSKQLDVVVWVNRTKELLKKIFIISANDKIKSIEEISFVSFYQRDLYQVQQHLEKAKERAKRYLEEYILEIETHNIEKKKTGNLELMKYWGIWSVIVGTAFTLGLYFGQSKFDKDKAESFDECKALRLTKKTLLFKVDSLHKKQQSDLLEKRHLIDSINGLHDELRNAYFYIGTLKKK